MARFGVFVVAASLFACGPTPPDNFPHGIPDPCPDFPVVSVERCLQAGWVPGQAAAMGEWCGDLLVKACYDKFLEEQQAFGSGSCDSYWMPCMLPSDCATAGGDKPSSCHRITMSLFPTWLDHSGYVNPNLIGLACSKVLIPGKLQPTPVTGKPLLDGLTDSLELRSNPTWNELTQGSLTIDRTASMPVSASLPAPSTPQALAGQRSLAFFNWNQLCNGTGSLPTIADASYTMTESFIRPFKYTEDSIAGLSDCSNYVLNKYYDWAVFQMRTLPESDLVKRTPAILRVRAAFSPDLRGNLGHLALLDGPMSRSFVPAEYAVGPNKNFILWLGATRPANPFDEFLGMAARVARPSTPQDHRHRFLFTTPALASRSNPAEPENYPKILQTGQSWTSHAAMLQKYDNQQITPTDEKYFRLKRTQFLELVVRRAQLEVAASLAGRSVNLLSASTLSMEPSFPEAHKAWWLNLSSGIIEPSLLSITEDERTFIKTQYARDFDATKTIFKALTEAEVEARLKALDELIESDLTLVDKHTGASLVTTCLTLDVPQHSVLCDWLPEMFTDLFTHVTETDLLALTDKQPPADYPLAGPEADKRKCESYTRGLSFGKLGNGFEFKCPLNSDVTLGTIPTSKFLACTCDPAGTGFTCGHDHHVNTGSEAFPIFYGADDYLESLTKFETFFTRSDEMNDVAFAVATAFIPACSDSPTMTETHVKVLELGNGTFGASMTKNFYWSKNARDDKADLLASFNLDGTVLGISMPFVGVSANASKTRDADGQVGATVKIAGLDVPWTAAKSDHGSLGNIGGVFYFAIGPVPCSVHYGVKGDWKAHTTATTSAANVSLFASASAGARLYVEGGVDIGIAGVGLGVELELFNIGPVFDSRLGMRSTPPGQSVNISDSIELKSSLVLNTSLLSGRFYAWAEIGICPFCESFDVTLFSWAGYHCTTPLWQRQLTLTERNLDKLQSWHAPTTGCQ